MKQSLCSCALAAALVSSSLAGELPALGAREAIEIAERSLSTRGLAKAVYVERVTLERTSLFDRSRFWFVRWSSPIAASDPKKREVGVKVNMDGSATLLVKDPTRR